MKELNLEHRSLSDQVVKLLRKMILNGKLQPGERINQVQLAEAMNISRGPLREALRMLQNEGLIKHEINRGTFVTTLSPQDMWEIYTMRALLESHAAKLAMNNLTEQDFNRLYQLLDVFGESIRQRDLELMVQSDMEFHQTIVRASGHRRLEHHHGLLDVQLGAMFLTVSSRVPVRVHKVLENHQVLIEALLSKDVERVQKEFSAHYLEPLQDVQRNAQDTKEDEQRYGLT